MTDTSHQMNQDRANLPERVELARKPKRRDCDGMNDSDIILVFLPWNRCTPFATWEENLTEDRATYYGHYLHDLRAALEDYETR